MNPRTLQLVVALVVAAGAVVAFAALRDDRADDDGTRTAAPDLADELAALADAQRRTAAALERLERRLADELDAPLDDPADARRPAGGASAPPPSFDELIASLDALRETFESESRRTQELIRDAPGFGGESLLEMRDRSAGPNWVALEALETSWREDRRRADRAQYLMTSRDLLRRYGPPTSIYRPTGGLLFVYRQHEEGGSGPAWYFRLQEGLVIEFWIEDEVAEPEGEDG